MEDPLAGLSLRNEVISPFEQHVGALVRVDQDEKTAHVEALRQGHGDGDVQWEFLAHLEARDHDVGAERRALDLVLLAGHPVAAKGIHRVDAGIQDAQIGLPRERNGRGEDAHPHVVGGAVSQVAQTKYPQISARVKGQLFAVGMLCPPSQAKNLEGRWISWPHRW
jgi:hypothetical protein